MIFLGEKFENCNRHNLIPFAEFFFTIVSKEKNSIVSELFSYLETPEKKKGLFLQMLSLFSEVEFLTDFNDSGMSKYRY